jgi:hypothetical protein
MTKKLYKCELGELGWGFETVIYIEAVGEYMAREILKDICKKAAIKNVVITEVK